MFRQEMLAHTLICFRLSTYYPSIVAGEKAYRDLSGKGKKQCSGQLLHLLS